MRTHKLLVYLTKLSLFSILLSIAGCLNYTQEVHLYPDGSGKMKINYWMNLPENEDTTTINKIGIFNRELIEKEFSSAYTVLNNVEVYIDSVDSTTHALIDLNFAHIDSLNNVKVFEDFQFSLKDGASGQKIFSQFIPPIATGFGIDGSEYIITYVYKFSGTIITHNAQIEDGQTLTWNYTLAEIGSGKTISVTFRPFKLKETPYWIYVLSGIVLLIVIIFLFRKKKD
ncbi:MAG: hypothetical protein Q7S39_07665 [Ignavibacteria bacterium]|nr:hypothetical protein [Ignavibacteria bacterium]